MLSIRAPLIRYATDNAGGPKSFAAALDADKCEIWVGATCQISASCAFCRRRRHPQKVGACCSFHLQLGKDAPSSLCSAPTAETEKLCCLSLAAKLWVRVQVSPGLKSTHCSIFHAVRPGREGPRCEKAEHRDLAPFCDVISGAAAAASK